MFVLRQNLVKFKSAQIFLYKPWGPKGYYQFELAINVLVSCCLLHLNTNVMGLSPL